MSELGRAFVELAGVELSRGDVTETFRRVEPILECGAEADTDAVATGLLEAVAAAKKIDRSSWRTWILDHADSAAREYLAERDQSRGNA